MTLNKSAWNKSRKIKAFLRNVLILLVIGPMLLTLCGCLTRGSSSGLTVVEYSKETQKSAANELRSCIAPTITVFMSDYHVLREQARVK
jgi:hypothetical protein